MYGGQSTYIPLKVNQSGVIPIIFASSVLYLPNLIAVGAAFGQRPGHQHLGFERPASGSTATLPTPPAPVYLFFFGLMIIGFAYFYTAISFDPGQAGRHHPQAGRLHSGHPSGAADRALPRLAS